MFKALLVEKDDSGLNVGVREIEDDRLPEGNVTVAVDYSTLNYKDGLALAGAGSVVKSFPHIPGVDFAGRVEASDDPRFRPGDAVILNGWRVGEFRWGGFATRARVQGDWLVPVPEGLTTRDAMVVGTAGYTAALAIMALEEHGLTPGAGEVLVTGASGGVGSIAVALLKAAGYEIAAVTGRPETEGYLRDLGASRIVPRADLDQAGDRPLERETWAGAIDNVGGPMLARLLGQMRYGASVAAVGLVGGGPVPATIYPFILRGVNLLGIESVMAPIPRREAAWARIARDLPRDKLDAMAKPATLADLPALGEAIRQGHVRGRVVVDVNA